MLEHYRIRGQSARQIAASIERGLGTGRLGPGSALPPIRDLADQLGVNANTVAAGYRLLRDRGIVETAGRRGSRIRSRPASTARGLRAVPIAVPPDTRDLSAGNPDPDLLPPLRAAVAAAARSPRVGYGERDVSPRLAGPALERLRADRIPIGPSAASEPGIAVTSGALDGIERVLAAHLRPGDPIAIEDPGWANLIDLVGGYGLRPVGVPVDDHGPVPAELARALAAGARAAVVTSRAQNPFGSCLTAERSRQLRRVLRGHRDVLLIEDDHAAEVAGTELHTLAGATGTWAHVRSVSKPLGPDLRLAVLAADALTLDRVRGRQRLGAGWVSHLLQDTVAWLWADPAIANRGAMAAETYRQRRTGLITALSERGVPGHGRSGLNVWIPVPDETAMVAALLAAGWAVAPGARFRLGSAPAIRITVATLRPDELEPLAGAIATAWHRRTGARMA